MLLFLFYLFIHLKIRVLQRRMPPGKMRLQPSCNTPPTTNRDCRKSWARDTHAWNLQVIASRRVAGACKPVFDPFDFCFPYFPPDSNPNSILYERGPNWGKITTFRYVNCVKTLHKGTHHPDKSPHRILGRNTCRSRLEFIHASLIILGRSFPWLNVGNCLLKVRCIVWIIMRITWVLLLCF